MDRFRIEFAASGVDESRLREVLEHEFGLDQVLIRRAPISTMRKPATMARSVRMVLDAFADGLPRRRKQLVVELGTPRITVARSLAYLTELGELRRLRRGVYIRADAPEPTVEDTRPDRWGTSDRVVATLRYLDQPRTIAEVKAHLGLSAQMANKILRKLEHRGQVRRHPTPAETARFVFLRADLDAPTLLAFRQKRIPAIQGRVISALAPDQVSRIGDVATTAQTGESNIRPLLARLSELGLVYTLRLGQRRYAGLTAAGAVHPDYAANADKAVVADLVADFGLGRAACLQALSVIPNLGARELTDALSADLFVEKRNGSSRVVQNLEAAGLIAPNRADGRRPTYRLTDAGAQVAAVLNRASPPVTQAELERRISGNTGSSVSPLT